jgi:hypothetical protein
LSNYKVMRKKYLLYKWYWIILKNDAIYFLFRLMMDFVIFGASK